MKRLAMFAYLVLGLLLGLSFEVASTIFNAWDLWTQPPPVIVGIFAAFGLLIFLLILSTRRARGRERKE